MSEQIPDPFLWNTNETTPRAETYDATPTDDGNDQPAQDLELNGELKASDRDSLVNKFESIRQRLSDLQDEVYDKLESMIDEIDNALEVLDDAEVIDDSDED